MKLEIGDRVKWSDHEMWLKKTEGSLGTVVKVDEWAVIVKWDRGLPKPLAYHESHQIRCLVKAMYCWDFQERIKERLG